MDKILETVDKLSDSVIVGYCVAAVFAGLMIGLVTLAVLQPDNPFVL